MSTHEDIMAVYEDEIANKTRLVESRFGKKPFYNDFRGFSVEHILDNLGIDRIVCKDYTPKGKKCQKN